MLEHLNLPTDQIEFLTSMLNHIQQDDGIDNPSLVLDYDRAYGGGEAVELLNAHFYDLVNIEGVAAKHARSLAKIVAGRERQWVTKDEYGDYEYDQVGYDGYGYVWLKGGARVDEHSEEYREEREAFNTLRAARLSKTPTNGKEFLR